MRLGFQRCTVPFWCGASHTTPPMTNKSTNKKAPKKRQNVQSKQAKPARSSSSRNQSASQRSTHVGTSAFNINSVGQGHIRVRGHEILGSVIPLVSTAPSLAAVFDSNPACWTSSRLSLTACSYEKYRYNSARIRYIPSVSTTQSGSIALAIETDPDERLPADADAVTRTMNNQFSGLGSVWAPLDVMFRRDPKDQDWYKASILGEDVREAVTQFLVYAVTDVTNLANSALGRLVIEYDIEFMYPELEVQDGGSQYQATQINTVAGVAGAPLEIDTSGSPSLFTGSQVVEFRPVGDVATTLVVNQGNNTFNIKRGQMLYASYSGKSAGGGSWQAFISYASAKTATSPLVWASAAAVTSIAGYYRRLSAKADAR